MRLLSLVLATSFACPAQAPEHERLQSFQFAARTLGGQQIQQDMFKDNVLIVDLWGTWCPPCREAVPRLVALYEKYKHQGLEIVGFNYAADGSGEDVTKVREFAVANHITYTLAQGSAAIRSQVPGFNGYPTILLFKKGLVNDKVLVGFSAGEEEVIEKWLRGALELDKGDTRTEAQREADKEKAEAAKEDVPKGRINLPGNHDTGFEWSATDVDGKALETDALHGSPFLLALTTTWDQDAVRTSQLLEQLRKDFPKLTVVAACLEKDRDPEKKATAVRTFREQQKCGYRMVAADLQFAIAKVHKFAALPTLLVFDGEGRLVLREGGMSDAIVDRVRAKAAELGK